MEKNYNQYTPPKYTKDELIAIARGCKTIKEFRYNGHYDCAKRRNDCLDECISIINKNKIKNKEKHHNEMCIRIRNKANEYYSKSLFQKDHPRLYYYDRVNNLGILDSLIPKQKVSHPQLICKMILEKLFTKKCKYNDRSALSGKELDIYFPELQVACEYNSFYWHKNRKETDDYKKQICKSLDILLVVIEESKSNSHAVLKECERDIKIQIIDYLDRINDKLKSSFTANNINSIIVNYDEFLKYTYSKKDINFIINECDRYSDVKNKYNKIWQFLVRNKLLHLLDPVKQRDYIYMDEENFINHVMCNFKSYSEFTKHKIYQLARKRGYINKIKQLM